MGIGIKVPKKKARLAPVKKTAKNTISFDGWEQMTGADYHRRVYNLRSELYEMNKAADLAPEVWAWMKENGYTKDDIEAAKKRGANVTIGITCKLLRSGMPDLNPKHKEYWEALPGTGGELKPATDFVRRSLEEAIIIGRDMVEETKEEEAVKKNTYVPTIQERITEQSRNAAEDIDIWLDGFIEDKANFDPKGFDFKKHFTQKGVTQAHARKLVGFYEGELEEFRELQRMPTAGQLSKMDERTADMWAQLKEGYSHLSKKDVQNYITALESLVDACNFVVDQSKATRKPRKAKPRSADKLVEKLKYCKVDNKYQLASISPVDIIGASELWVFNIKSRKLGKYVAANIDPKGLSRGNSGLQVKGTTIIGFDEKLSVQKTLRKPEEQLKEFKAAGKVALRKFLEEINTTDTALNGRINLETVLLKVN